MPREGVTHHKALQLGRQRLQAVHHAHMLQLLVLNVRMCCSVLRHR